MEVTRSSLLAAGLLAGLALLSACGGADGADPVEIDFATPTPTSPPLPTASAAPTPTATPTPSPDVCTPNPDPVPEGILTIDEPEAREEVGNPFHVRGWGSNIGKNDIGVVVAVIDATGDVVVALDAPPQPRSNRILPRGVQKTEFTQPFGVDVLLSDLKARTSFCIWVFSQTDSRGNPKDVLQRPITVRP